MIDTEDATYGLNEELFSNNDQCTYRIWGMNIMSYTYFFKSGTIL